MKLLKKRILVEKVEEKRERPSGIYVPETVKGSCNQAVVKIVAEDCDNVAVGSKIIFKEGAGIAFDYENSQHLIMFEHDIVAII